MILVKFYFFFKKKKNLFIKENQTLSLCMDICKDYINSCGFDIGACEKLENNVL